MSPVLASGTFQIVIQVPLRGADGARTHDRRIMRSTVDAATLQNLYDFGGEIFEGEPFEPVGRAARVQGLADEIDALQMIFMVNERAMFEFAVTEASLREVINRTRPCYTQWVYDVLDT